MPKAPRTSQDIEAFKNKILEASLEIIFEEGFKHLSMRKLASRLKMTAANIYNYYASKDELYLEIQTIGFQLLYDNMERAYKEHDHPVERLKGIVSAYLNFGMKNPEYYEIMLNRNTPKYADYVGTKLEPTAYIEKQTALKVADLAMRVISEVKGSRTEDEFEESRVTSLEIWSTLHGLVTLHNTRILPEVDDNPFQLIQTISEKIVRNLENSFCVFPVKR